MPAEKNLRFSPIGNVKHCGHPHQHARAQPFIGRASTLEGTFMQISRRRILLLASVSLSTIAVPALAGTAVHPGITHVDVSDPVEDLLTICLADEECLFGVEAEAGG